MKMKFFSFLLISVLSTNCFAQDIDKKEVELISDTFLDISFHNDKLTITKNGLKVLDQIGSKIDLIDQSKFELWFEVIPSRDEIDETLPYKRVSVILNLLKVNYQIDKSIFKFVFYEAIDNEAIIRFSIR